MKKFKHLSLVLMASALGLSSCSLLDTILGKGVVSVEISAKLKNVYECSDPFKLEAKVEVKKDTDDSVTWSSSNEKVAKVSDKGVVTPLKAGKVEITATSVHDTKKSDTLEIDVLAAGNHKKMIGEGYDYSASFPEKQVNKFAGTSLPTFETDEGFYYKESYNSKYKYYYYEVFFDYTEDNALAFEDAVSDSDLYYFEYIDGFYIIDCFLDPELKVELDVDYTDISDEDAEDYEWMYYITYYHTEDIWASSVDTTDTEWNADVVEELGYLGVDLPFVTLGEEYMCEYDEDYETLYIVDGCCDYTKLENYGAVLEGELFTKVVDEEGYVYYTKQLDTYTDACVAFGFDGNNGNTITVSYLPREIDFYPDGKINTFVEETIGSVWSIPEYNETENATYKYEEHANDGYWARLTIFGCTEAECLTYVGSLVAAGYVIDEEGSYQKSYGYSVINLQKDKIYLQAAIVFGSHESSEDEIEEMLGYYATYSQYTQDQIDALTDEEKDRYDLVMEQYDEYELNALFDEYYFTVYEYDVVESAILGIWQAEDTYGKEAGIYVDSETVSLTVGGEHTIKYSFFEMEPQSVTFASSDESVLTVTSEGVVTAVAAGEATVTVKSLDETVQAVVTVTVSAAE